MPHAGCGTSGVCSLITVQKELTLVAGTGSVMEKRELARPMAPTRNRASRSYHMMLSDTVCAPTYLSLAQRTAGATVRHRQAASASTRPREPRKGPTRPPHPRGLPVNSRPDDTPSPSRQVSVIVRARPPVSRFRLHAASCASKPATLVEISPFPPLGWLAMAAVHSPAAPPLCGARNAPGTTVVGARRRRRRGRPAAIHATHTSTHIPPVAPP